jgi:hypothetical protein
VGALFSLSDSELDVLMNLAAPLDSARDVLLMSLCGREPPDGQANVHSR